MAADPGGELAAHPTGHGRLRASHGDREQVIDVLKTAFVQGRLAKDEFDGRVGSGVCVADLRRPSGRLRPISLPGSSEPCRRGRRLGQRLSRPEARPSSRRSSP